MGFECLFTSGLDCVESRGLMRFASSLRHEMTRDPLSVFRVFPCFPRAQVSPGTAAEHAYAHRGPCRVRGVRVSCAANLRALNVRNVATREPREEALSPQTCCKRAESQLCSSKLPPWEAHRTSLGVVRCLVEGGPQEWTYTLPSLIRRA